eukprot:1096831-Prymnesium_polylepis.2
MGNAENIRLTHILCEVVECLVHHEQGGQRPDGTDSLHSGPPAPVQHRDREEGQSAVEPAPQKEHLLVVWDEEGLVIAGWERCARAACPVLNEGQAQFGAE